MRTQERKEQRDEESIMLCGYAMADTVRFQSIHGSWRVTDMPKFGSCHGSQRGPDGPNVTLDHVWYSLAFVLINI